MGLICFDAIEYMGLGEASKYRTYQLKTSEI